MYTQCCRSSLQIRRESWKSVNILKEETRMSQKTAGTLFACNSGPNVNLVKLVEIRHILCIKLCAHSQSNRYFVADTLHDFGRQGWISCLVFMEHGYNTLPYDIIPCNTSLAEPVATKYDHLYVLPIFARCRYVLEKSPLARRRSGTMSGQSFFALRY